MTPADHARRAGALLAAGDKAGAARAYREAARGDASLFGRLALARALIVEDAPVERHLRATLAAFPDSGAAAGMLGTALAEAGRIDEARALFARAVATDPAQRGYYYDLARSGPATPALLEQLDGALGAGDLTRLQRVALHLARGKARDDLDDSDGAAADWRAAGATQDAIMPYDGARVTALTERIVSAFTPEAMARIAPLSAPARTPLLIVGLPRSGTTLVEALLANHPKVAAGGERDELMRACTALTLPPDAVDAAAALREWLSILGKLARPATRYVTDKLPHNYHWLGWVHAAVPTARIVHVRRDARDVALSTLATYFGRSDSFPALPADIVRHVEAYRRLMAHWRTVLPATALYEIDYEGLVADPEREMRALTAWLDLPWHAGCAEVAARGAAIKSASKYQVRRPIGGGSVGRWRRYAAAFPEFAALA